MKPEPVQDPSIAASSNVMSVPCAGGEAARSSGLPNADAKRLLLLRSAWRNFEALAGHEDAAMFDLRGSWMEDDPSIIHELRSPKRVNTAEVRRGVNPISLKLLEHTRTRLECNHLLPNLQGQPARNKRPLEFRSKP